MAPSWRHDLTDNLDVPAGVNEVIETAFQLSFSEYRAATWRIMARDQNFWIVVAVLVSVGILSLARLMNGADAGFTLGIAAAVAVIVFRRLFVWPWHLYQRRQIGLNTYSYGFSPEGIVESIS